jgi:hypothetical protein
MRDAQQPWRGDVAATGRGVACALVLALSAGCATDDLNRLGAGRGAITDGSHPTSNNTSLPNLIDAGTADAGASTQPAASVDAGVVTPTSPELIPNPSFEGGHEGWSGFGDSRIVDVAIARTGVRSIMSTNRVQPWEGPSYDIEPLVNAGQAYGVSAWVRNEYGTHIIMLTLKIKCGDDVDYTRLATRAVASEWQQLDASFFAPDCEELQELLIYVEGPPAYKNVLVDDISLRSIAFSESGG